MSSNCLESHNLCASVMLYPLSVCVCEQLLQCASVFTCRRKVAYKEQFKLPVWEFSLPPLRAEVMMHGVINRREYRQPPVLESAHDPAF